MKQWSIRHFDRIVKLRNQGLKWDETSEYFDDVTTGAVKTKRAISKLKFDGLSYSKIAEELNTTKSAIAGACWRWKL